MNDNHTKPGRFLIPLVLIGVLGWGILIAIGSMMSSEERDFRRLLIPLGVTIIFVVGWYLLWRARFRN